LRFFSIKKRFYFFKFAVYFTKSTLLEGKIQDLLGVFNMAGHMDNFVNGILDIGGVVYYLSVIAICTFLAMQSLQKKRWN
jgi:ABC-2 type transport system permease protein